MYILVRLDGEMIHIWSMLTQVFWLYTLIINKLAEGGGVFVYMYMYTLSSE